MLGVRFSVYSNIHNFYGMFLGSENVEFIFLRQKSKHVSQGNTDMLWFNVILFTLFFFWYSNVW